METRGTSRRLFILRSAASAAGMLMAPILPALNWRGPKVNSTPANLKPALRTKRISGIVLDTSNPLANFTQEGGQSFTGTPSVLSINDAATTDIVNFYAPHSDAASGAVDIFADFMVVAGSLAGADLGVHLVINDGASRAVIAACIVHGGVKGIGLASGANFSDPGNYGLFVPVDWSSRTTIRIRRTVEGHAEIVEINGTAPSPRALLDVALLSPRNRVGSTFEFGAAGPEATAHVDFYQFRSETVANQIIGAMATTTFRIGDSDSGNRIRMRGDFTLGGGTDGIDPSSEQVEVRLSTPTNGTFYSKILNGFDPNGQTPRRRWLLNSAEKIRTGIEQLVIDEDPGNRGALSLQDRTASIPNIDYSTVHIEVGVGLDLLTETVHLVERPANSGSWRLVS